MRGDKLLIHIWKRENPGCAGIILNPFSAAYGAIVRLRNYLYDTKLLPTERLPCPVISVGNLTVGGTGKTPMTIFIGKMVFNSGWRPVIVSRGYKGNSKAKVNVVSTEREILLSPKEAGDEPVLMAKKLRGIPVITGKDRFKAGMLACERFAPDVIICDDAFQHRRLARNLDILLISAARPFGNGRLLPAGPLREPIESLKRADIIVATKKGRENPTSPLPPAFTARLVKSGLFHPETEAFSPPEILRGKRVFAFAGIAEPDSFLEMLKETGAEIVRFLTFPDHYPYTRQDLEQIKGIALRERCEYTCTTEKDAVKVSPLSPLLPGFVALQVEMVVEEEESFRQKIMNVIETWKRRRQ